MEINAKVALVAVLASAAVGAGLTRAYAPREVIQTKVIEKVVTKDRIVTVTKEVRKPDGSTEINSTTTDDRTAVEDKHTVIKDTKAPAKPDWHISGTAGFDRDFVPVYGLQVERRIVGPVYLGAFGRTDRSVGISLGFEF